MFSRIKASSSSLLLLISLLCLISGLIGIIFVQYPREEQSFDIRQQASTPDVVTELVLTSDQANTRLTDTNGYKTITFDLANTDANEISIRGIVTAQSIVEPELIAIDPAYSVTSSEVQQVADGYLFDLLLTKTNTNTDANASLFGFTFKSSLNEPILISFDAERTVATVDSVSKRIATSTVKVEVAGVNDTTRPTPTISTRATPVPSATIRPTPTPSPTSLRSCNQSCTTNAECPNNHLCYNTGSNKVCRLVTNPSSTSCSTPTDNGLNRQCNQYCADNRECSSGLTCWFNRCRRPNNIDSTSCSVPSTTTTQTIAQNCNVSCASNRDCAVNMRCYNNQCRLASNPSSTSCSALTTPVVSDDYDTKGGTTATTSATVSPSPVATASATPRVSPSAVVLPSIKPAPSPVTQTPPETTDDGFLASVRQYFTDNSRQLALGLLALGIIILVLFVIAKLISMIRNRKPPQSQLPSNKMQDTKLTKESSSIIDQRSPVTSNNAINQTPIQNQNQNLTSTEAKPTNHPAFRERLDQKPTANSVQPKAKLEPSPQSTLQQTTIETKQQPKSNHYPDPNPVPNPPMSPLMPSHPAPRERLDQLPNQTPNQNLMSSEAKPTPNIPQRPTEALRAGGQPIESVLPHRSSMLQRIQQKNLKVGN